MNYEELENEVIKLRIVNNVLKSQNNNKDSKIKELEDKLHVAEMLLSL